ncbi:peptidase [Streptomyces sp. TG1A-60]|uniref:trypsin-like serine peptidase n=1 Tax=Streptomyces sp. TG1A-60 TaxID=3129111 RepID=UPI0030CBE114
MRDIRRVSRPLRKSRSVLAALFGATALLGTGVFASPAGAATAAADPASFWTAERMRQAAPLDLLPVDRAQVEVPSLAKGKERTIAPTLPGALNDVGALAFPNSGGPWTGGGAVVSTAGRVFFTYQGRTASCSGNAVTSANKSTVITAGHCVKLEGAWHTNWVFVPGYHDGQAPYGRWSATKTLSTPQWTASEDINYDVGAAVVAPLDGRLLTDVVGGQGLAFNTGYNQAMYAFGFPAASPYDGEKFIYCSGTTNRDFLLSNDHGMNCNMTGGSSGGPWFTQFNESTGTGLLSSVNSFKYNFLPNRMYGPYFGTDAQNLYQTAQSS